MNTTASALRLGAVITSAVYAVVLYIAGVRLQHDLKQALSYLPAALTLLTVVFDKWVWKVPLVHRLLSRPHLEGVWKVTLRPTAESHIPKGGNRGPIEAYIIIEQSYWSIHVTQHTAESSSHSVTSTFRRRADSGQQILTFVYENVPQQKHLARSPRHVGACELAIAIRMPSSISGYYYTDRYTKGDMQLELGGRKTGFEGFDSAKAYYAETAQ